MQLQTELEKQFEQTLQVEEPASSMKVTSKKDMTIKTEREKSAEKVAKDEAHRPKSPVDTHAPFVYMPKLISPTDHPLHYQTIH